jgi:DHA3 family tetracycline resistance protein-like MFS transporter
MISLNNGRPNAYGVYLILSAGNALFFALVFTVNMVYQASVIGLGPLQLVLVGTTLELAVFLFEVPTGVVADLYSRRLSIIIGTVLIGMGFMLEGLVPTFAAVLLTQVLWGIGYTFTSGATQAWIVDEVGEANLGNIFIRGSQVSKIGGIVGILLSVLLGSIAINIPIALGGALFLTMALFFVFTMPETGFKPLPREDRTTVQSMIHTFRQGLGEMRLQPVLMLVAGLGIFYGLYSEGYDRLWTPHLLDNIGLPEIGNLEPVIWFGIFNIAGMITGIAAAELLRRLVNTDDNASTIRAMTAISAGMVVTLAIFALALSFPVALAALLAFNALRGLIDPLMSALMNRYIPSNVRATVLSTYGQIDAFGQIGGGPVVGVIGQQLGVRAALLTSAVILSPILLIYARLIRVRPTVAAEGLPLNDAEKQA